MIGKKKNNNSHIISNRRFWICKRIEPIKHNIDISLKENINHNVKSVESVKSNDMVSKNKKQKVALCISGNLRTFNQTFPNINKNILSQYNCDVFIHTWENCHSNNLIDKIDHSAIVNLFGPKNIVIEKNKQFIITPIMEKQKEHGRNIQNMLSMFYKIKKCNDLKNEYEKQYNIKYDAVIRFRSDILLLDKLPINGIEKDYLYSPVYGNFGGLCDQIAFGSSDIMNKYCSLFDFIEQYLTEGQIFNPEKILLYHIQKQNIKINRFSSKFFLQRKNGEIQDNFLLEKKYGFIK